MASAWEGASVRRSPKHQSEPSFFQAHVFWKPAATRTTSLIPETRVGTELEWTSPRPRAPYSLRPQHHKEPSRRATHAWLVPAATETTSSGSLGTRVGPVCGVTSPTPS